MFFPLSQFLPVSSHLPTHSTLCFVFSSLSKKVQKKKSETNKQTTQENRKKKTFETTELKVKTNKRKISKTKKNVNTK